MRPLLAAVAVALVPATVVAQTNRWERQVQEQLERVSPHARTTKTGVLNLEESEWFAVTLTAGVSYSIIGVCDNDCSSLQLVLATPDRNELVTDRRGENFPVVRFTPPETRVFRVKVVMDACLVSPCWYGVAVVERQ
jgi:hypothetical protein